MIKNTIEIGNITIEIEADSFEDIDTSSIKVKINKKKVQEFRVDYLKDTVTDPQNCDKDEYIIQANSMYTDDFAIINQGNVKPNAKKPNTI